MPTFVVGGTNARLHGRVSGMEETIVGSHVFGWGNFLVDYLSDEQRENRQFLFDFCTANDFIVSNTLFIKPDECKYKDTRTNGFVGLWTPDRFAQMDLILASKQWRNTISDVHAHTNIAFDCDHVFVTADVRIKLSASKQTEKRNCRSKRYCIPTQQQVDNYNQHIQSIFIFIPVEDKLANCSSFVTVMKEAAQSHFQAKSSRQNREYLSGHTWQLIQSRQEARLRSDYHTENLLSREIKKIARKDEMTWRTDKLADLTDKKNVWKQIRFENKLSLLDFTI